jgi:hypothetical protein
MTQSVWYACREDTPKLGPNYAVSLDPFFEVEKALQQALGDDPEKTLAGVPIHYVPVAANARRWEVSLQAGQVCGCLLCVCILFESRISVCALH